jgi:PPK2 family polyphosphate:nucleotide phosphotransferase
MRVAAFKQPSQEELSHDYLWRVHKEMPAVGELCVFNRSHYEDVLIVRVHNLVPEDRWHRRYEQINAFEEMASQEGTTVVKCFLHISRDEQARRLRARLEDPTKRWKFKVGDLDDHERWDDYMAAYAIALERCNTEQAPWFILPADRKWYRNWALEQLLIETLREMGPTWPERPDLDIPALKRRIAELRARWI